MQRVVANFEGFEKCTWTMMSATKAPSFKLSSGDAALTDKFDIMYQEWVDGWQLDKDTDFNDMQDNGTITSMNGIVFPHILHAKYAKVAKHNYTI